MKAVTAGCQAFILTTTAYFAGLVAYIGDPDYPQTYVQGLKLAARSILTWAFWPCVFNIFVMFIILYRLHKSKSNV